jgi:hypothetical protein
MGPRLPLYLLNNSWSQDAIAKLQHMNTLRLTQSWLLFTNIYHVSGFNS